MNVNKNNGKNDIKTEDGVKMENDIRAEDNKTIEDVEPFSISQEFKNLINIIYNDRLLYSDLHLNSFSSQKSVLKNSVSKCLPKKIIRLD